MIAMMNTGEGHIHRWGRNGMLCVTVGRIRELLVGHREARTGGHCGDRYCF